MTEERARALGLRWLAAGGGWMGGMLAVHLEETRKGFTWRVCTGDLVDAAGEPWALSPKWWPDPRDPATLGCWTARVREVWGEEGAYACWLEGSWAVWAPTDSQGCGSRRLGEGDIEAGSWVAALEAKQHGG